MSQHPCKSMAVGVASAAIAAALMMSGCSREPELEMEQGSDVSVESKDGKTISGRLVEVKPEEVVVETKEGAVTGIPRSEIRAVHARRLRPAPPAAEGAASVVEMPRKPEYREIEVPAGTTMSIALGSGVGSATSRVEDRVRGTIRRTVTVDGMEVIPAGSTVAGVVTQADRSGRVKGRARVAFRFTELTLAGGGERLDIRTASVAREAEGTKKADAAKIGGGAAAGAVIGGIVGGGDGAAKGAAIGGGAGTGVVLATRGKEVSLPAGTTVTARLAEPLVVRIKVHESRGRPPG